MRISVTIFVILISTYVVNASVLDPVIENVVHLKASKPPSGIPGIWKKKTVWKPRWVKEWKSAKVMKPIWRKVWSPIQIREWVPIPKPPPGWDSILTPLAPVHSKAQKVPFKAYPGHDSFESSTKMLLWDPIPYPDSQQPPPQPLSQASYNSDVLCSKSGCDSTYSQSITHQQISEAIGSRYQTPEYYQNPDYPERINHPTNGNNWRLPQSHQNYFLDNNFKNFQGLSEFLVPPKFQLLPESNFPFLHITKHNPGIANTPVSPSSEREMQNGYRPSIPLPLENKIKGHLITRAPKQPNKLPTPDVELRTKNDENNPHKKHFQNSNNILEENSKIQTQNTSTALRPQAGGDFIQEAQLVGEFHYTHFDLHNLNPEPKEPQLNLEEIEEKEQIIHKSQQKKEITEQEIGQNAEQNRHQSVTENKRTETNGKPTRTEINNASVRSESKQPEFHNSQDRLKTEKKIISNSNSNKSKFTFNFSQQEATAEEIFPIYKTPQNINPTTDKNQYLIATTPEKNQEKPIPLNHSSTKLIPTSSNTTDAMFNVQEQMEIYPIFEIPKRVNPIFIPPNHRFFHPSEIKLQENPFPSNNSTRLIPVSTKSEKSTLDKTGSVQLVFATTSDDYDHSKKDLQKITTTEPYEIIFPSSSLSTTEATTKNSPIIVTPANSYKS